MDPSALTWFLYRIGKQVIESELLTSFVTLFLAIVQDLKTSGLPNSITVFPQKAA